VKFLTGFTDFCAQSGHNTVVDCCGSYVPTDVSYPLFNEMNKGLGLLLNPDMSKLTIPGDDYLYRVIIPATGSYKNCKINFKYDKVNLGVDTLLVKKLYVNEVEP